MSTSDQNKPTSPKEFNDYLEGKLSKKQQHALEKKLLDDDFETEALEGIENLSSENLQSDLAELQGRLFQKQKNNHFSYWRAAAVLALLISATIAIFYVVDVKDETNIVKQEAPKVENKGPSELDQSASEPKAEDTIAGTIQKIEEDKNDAPLALMEEKEVEDGGDQEASSSEVLAYADVPNEEQPQINKQETESFGQNEKSEILPVESRNSAGLSSDEGIKETQLEPIPETGTINRVATSEVLPADDAKIQNEDFEIPSSIAYNEEMEEEPVYDESTTETKSIASRKKQKAKRAEAAPTSAPRLIETEYIEDNPSPYPEIGMDEFIQYLKNNLSFVPSDSTIQLTMLVTDSGDVVEISTIEKLSRKELKELENIITTGSAWKPAVVNGFTIEKQIELKIQW